MRDKLGKLRRNINRRWSRGIDGRHLVEQIGEPHELFVPAEVQSPHSIVDHLVAYVDLLRQSLFGKMQYGGTDSKVFVEPVLGVKSEKRLSLHREERLVLKRNANVGSCINYALVGNRNDAHTVVHRIIAVFNKRNSTGSNNNRTSRHIHGVQAYCRA